MNKFTLNLLIMSAFSIMSIQTSSVSANEYLKDLNRDIPFRDEKSIIRTSSLPIPVTNEATNVSEKGYTANWEPVNGADGYIIYSIMTHTAMTNEDYKIVNEDFSKIVDGTIEDPVNSGNVEIFIDDYSSLCDWLAEWPVFAEGMLGLNNQYAYAGFPGALSSSKYDLSNNNGEFYLELSIKGVDITEVEISHYVGLGEELIDSKKEQVTGEFQKLRFDFDRGSKDSKLKIVSKGTGILFIDALLISQELKPGESTSMKHAFAGTYDTTCDFATPNKTTSDGFSYIVAAISEYEGVGNFSTPQIVDYSSGIEMESIEKTIAYVDEGLIVKLTEASLIHVYSTTGVCVSQIQGKKGDNFINLPESGIYMIKVHKKVFRVVK